MADEEESKGIPWGVVTGLLALVGGTIAILAPLTSSRPFTRTGISEEGYQDQDVAAHLWQDPLEAMEAHRRHDKQTDHYDKETHALGRVREWVTGRPWRPGEAPVTPQPCQILAVMTQGGADEEKIERRLRDRVAVVEGLSRAGYKPENERYIGYFAIPWTRKPLADNRWDRAYANDLPAVAEYLEEIQEEGDSQEERHPSEESTDHHHHCPSGVDHFPAPPSEAVSDSKANLHAEEAKNGTLLRIPFERFDREYPGQMKSAADRQLVLWLDADYFQDQPLHRLAQLLGLFADETGVPVVQSVVLGPESSGTLHAMVEEVQTSKPPEPLRKLLSKTTVYSDRASASDAILTYLSPDHAPANPGPAANPVTPVTVDAILNDNLKPDARVGKSAEGFHFIRTIATDDEIFRTVLQELERRDITFSVNYGSNEQPAASTPGNQKSATPKPGKLLALLTEEDTFFGRAILPEFLTAMSSEGIDHSPVEFSTIASLISQDHAGQTAFSRTPFHDVFAYQYLRGIDGRLPTSLADEKGSSGAESGKGESGGGERSLKSDPSKIESPDGMDQSDYLRRLATELLDGNAQMMRHSKSGVRSQIAAVGVLGSDVYDKLEILHALRKRLPDAIFFTNSMDARLFHPAEQNAARNLIVVSSYGLSLHDQYQEHTPPFRDSWQTARFAAVLRALHVIPDNIDLKTARPRIYEIARTEPWDLSEPDDPDHPKQSKYEDLPSEAYKVNPERVNYSQWWSLPLVITGWLFFALFATFMVMVTYMTPPDHRVKVAITFPLIAPILFILSFEFIALVYRHFWHRQADGEPFAFFEGISIWPTEGFRVFAALLCVYFMIVAVLSSNKNRDDTEDFFCLRQGSRVPRPWTGPVATQLWGTYLERTSLWATIRRVALFVVCYIAFSSGVIFVFGGSAVPARGHYARDWDRGIIFVSVIFFLILTFYVVHSILSMRRLIQWLNVDATYWPRAARLKWSAWPFLQPLELAELVDIRFIARRTEAIAPLIYYPFIIISIMILSRMPIFDNWDWPAGLVIILGTNTLVAAVCAFLLRSSAEEARSGALEKLRAALDQATDPDHKDQLRAAIKEVRNVEDGAFAAISQQPVIRAIALQGGGVAVLAVVRTFMT